MRREIGIGHRQLAARDRLGEDRREKVALAVGPRGVKALADLGETLGLCHDDAEDAQGEGVPAVAQLVAGTGLSLEEGMAVTLDDIATIRWQDD